MTHKAKSDPHTSALDAAAYQKPLKQPFPAWRLPNGIMNASDEDLDRSIGACEDWEWFGGFVVIFGVLATVAIAAFHPPYGSFFERWGSAIADTLVAIGVGVEIKFGQMAGLRQSEVKRRSDTHIAEANKIAAQANRDAADARERTAELERFTSWRHLGAEDCENISSAFSGKSDKLNILVEYQSGDPEAFSLASELARVFHDLGNEHIVFQANSHIGATLFGIIVRVGESEYSDEISSACVVAFGFNEKLKPENLVRFFGHGVAPPNLYLFVGPKPPPDFRRPVSEK